MKTDKLSLYLKFFREEYKKILFSSIVIWITIFFYSSSHSLELIFWFMPIFSIILSTIFYIEKAKLPHRIIMYFILGLLFGLAIYFSGIKSNSLINNFLVGMCIVFVLPLLVKFYLWVKNKVGEIWI